ncbi:MAG TPA: alpha/beta hydrolase [Gemmatimonadales bacterium]|nr:alpha/beta hydrolase [Gemmatimonadales bacterium]
MTWALIAVALYLGVLASLRLFEPRLLYFPGPRRVLDPPPASLGLPVERIEFQAEDGVRLVGWEIPAARPGGPWLLICHGNAGNISDFDRPLHYAGLRGLGLNLLAFDYRGYGESGGVSSERGLYQDAEAAYGYLRERRGVPADRIVVFGHSLGSAVAVELVGRLPAAGLIVEGAFTSAVDRGQELYPFIPVRWIAGSRFNSLHRIAQLRLPKLFLHAAGDEVIPLAHGRRLYQAAAAPKTFVELGGGHGDAFDTDSARYFGSIAAFVAGLTPDRR